jgi:hypothetical protein
MPGAQSQSPPPSTPTKNPFLYERCAGACGPATTTDIPFMISFLYATRRVTCLFFFLNIMQVCLLAGGNMQVSLFSHAVSAGLFIIATIIHYCFDFALSPLSLFVFSFILLLLLLLFCSLASCFCSCFVRLLMLRPSSLTSFIIHHPSSNCFYLLHPLLILCIPAVYPRLNLDRRAYILLYKVTIRPCTLAHGA